jgi:hypothetical protein
MMNSLNWNPPTNNPYKPVKKDGDDPQKENAGK